MSTRAERYDRRTLSDIERYRRTDGATAMRLMNAGLVEYRVGGGIQLTKAGQAALRASSKRAAAETGVAA